MFPNYIQPSHISAHNNSFCVDVQESVYIPRMIFCISNKHTCFSSIVQFGSHLFTFMYGNHCHFSKGSHVFHVACVLIIEQGIWRLCSLWPHHYVIQLCCCGNDFTIKFSFSFLNQCLLGSELLLLYTSTLVLFFVQQNSVEVFLVL